MDMTNLVQPGALMSNQVAVVDLVVNILLTAAMGQGLAFFYNRFGQTLSHRSAFSGNFLLLAITTMLVISIVKSSLALSLGLVGALSIVRFRSAIKEPEELVYLFFCIAIGLAFGADQRVLALVAYPCILLLLYGRCRWQRLRPLEGSFVHIVDRHEPLLAVDQVLGALAPVAQSVRLRRIDLQPQCLEVTLLTRFAGARAAEQALAALRALKPSVQCSIFDAHSGL